MTESTAPEFRTDILTGQIVLVAPGRSLRPSASLPDPLLPSVNDPFAEGNESETPAERLAARDPGTMPNGPGWKLRVVPNRYPSVILPTMTASDQDSGSAELKPDRVNSPSCGLFPSRPAYGEHDVIIECPDSRTRFAELSSEEVQRVLMAWRTRVQQLTAANRYASVMIFRNEGFSAGASLAHCHSQIVASEQMTPLDAERLARTMRYRKETNRDLIEDLLIAERLDGRRIVCETANFTALCPFASHTPWHVRIAPRCDLYRSFADLPDLMMSELAELAMKLLASLESALGGPFSFNFTLPHHPRLDQAPAFRWMLEILPRRSRHAGWEYLTGIDIITVAPEHSSAVLRELMQMSGKH